MSTLVGKKRELLKPLNELIIGLNLLTGDLAKLELTDNEQASRRVRKKLIELENIQFGNLKTLVTNIRVDINTSKGRAIKREKKSLAEKKEE